MIKSFRCKETKKLFNRQPIKRIPQNLQRTALRKLLILDAAESLEDLKSPAGNKLEAFKGDRQGQHSIRINEQFRLGFIWQGNDAHEVEIVDYY